MKKLKLVITFIILMLVSIMIISFIILPPDFMLRVLRYGNSDIGDINIFPNKLISKSEQPYTYKLNIDEEFANLKIEYISDKTTTTSKLSDLLETNDTRSFIVIKDDIIIYEEYFNGGSNAGVETSFSSVKSILSLLIGIAIEEGKINSVDDTLDIYINEFTSDERGKIKISELLRMRSKIRYFEGAVWFGDDAKTYYMPDLRSLAINDTKINKNYDGKFHYNNYHPLLLGVILENATGYTPSEYLEVKLWKKIGSNYDASWSVDSEENEFEKLESGFNFRSIDMIKIGSMLINNGRFNNNYIISPEWISTSIEDEIIEEEYEGSFLEDLNTGYGFMWYSMKNEDETLDYYAAGKYGQYIYISPVNNTVIVRTGSSYGSVDWWPFVLQSIAQDVGK